MANKTALIAMGKDEFVRRWNLGSAERKVLAELFDYSSSSALENAVNMRSSLEWLPTGKKPNDSSERQPRTTNSVSAIRQALVDLHDLKLISEIPSLHIGPVDQLVVNPAIAALVQPFFDAAPLNAGFVMAIRNVPIAQLREFGLVSNEMRDMDKAANQALLDKELAAKEFLRGRGWDVIVSDHLADDIAIWTLRLIESSDFEIGLIHAAETKAAIVEQERLASVAAAAAAETAARKHDAQIVAESIAIDAAAIAEREAMIAEMAAMKAELAAMRAATAKPSLKTVKKAA